MVRVASSVQCCLFMYRLMMSLAHQAIALRLPCCTSIVLGSSPFSTEHLPAVTHCPTVPLNSLFCTPFHWINDRTGFFVEYFFIGLYWSIAAYCHCGISNSCLFLYMNHLLPFAIAAPSISTVIELYPLYSMQSLFLCPSL